MIYCLQGRELTPVKFGYTENADTLSSRIRTLQTGYPYPLRCLFLQDGDKRLETVVHGALSSSRLLREWFEWTPDVEVFIRYVSSGHGITQALEYFLAAPKIEAAAHGERLLVAESSISHVFLGITSNHVSLARKAGRIRPDLETLDRTKRASRFYLFSTVADFLKGDGVKFRTAWYAPNFMRRYDDVAKP